MYLHVLYLKVLSFATERASLPDGWIDTELILPLENDGF